MTIKSLPLILLLSIPLTACSIMSEQECLTADWSSLGYIDGSQGASAAQFSERNNACSEYNVHANFTQYQQGYDKGIARYCTESHGFYAGSNGQSYHGVCPAKNADLFLKGYMRGQELFSLKQKVTRAEEALHQEERDVEYRKEQLAALKNSLIYDKLSVQERRRKVERIETLSLKRDAIHQRKRELHRLQHQLEHLRRTLIPR